MGKTEGDEMIRIRVVKAYELAVAGAAILLAAALIALLVKGFSGGEAAATSAPAHIETEYRPASGSAFADLQEETALAAFSLSALEEKPLFGEVSSLRVRGERIDIALHAQGEELIRWEKAPRVLIYHTHTYEAYTMEEDGLYEETEAWRTADSRYNVVRVGEELAKELQALGIEVQHDSTNHELPVLGTAYARSLETLSAHMDAGEQYDLCIDLHRDAYIAGTGENTVDTPAGRAAKCMFLIGTGDHFAVKPDAQANTGFAQLLTDELNDAAPGICRDVLVRDNRYNQHMGGHALLIEAGNNMNTLSEVLRMVPYLAEAIARGLWAEQSAAQSAEYMPISSVIK